MEGMGGTFCIQMVHLTVLCRLTGFNKRWDWLKERGSTQEESICRQKMGRDRDLGYTGEYER